MGNNEIALASCKEEDCTKMMTTLLVSVDKCCKDSDTWRIFVEKRPCDTGGWKLIGSEEGIEVLGELLGEQTRRYHAIFNDVKDVGTAKKVLFNLVKLQEFWFNSSYDIIDKLTKLMQKELHQYGTDFVKLRIMFDGPSLNLNETLEVADSSEIPIRGNEVINTLEDSSVAICRRNDSERVKGIMREQLLEKISSEITRKKKEIMKLEESVSELKKRQGKLENLNK